jgi:hypothetical protein
VRSARRWLPWFAYLSPLLLVAVALFARWVQGPAPASLTLTLGRVDATEGGEEFILIEAAERPIPLAELQAKAEAQRRGRERWTVSCDVVIDNRLGEEVPLTYRRKPFDGLRLVLWQGEQKVIDVPYGLDSTRAYFKSQPHALKVGPTRQQLRFAIDLAPGQRDGLEAQIVGVLPESPFQGTLASRRVKVRWLPPLPPEAVTLSLVKACGIKQQDGCVFSCEVVVENRAGEDLSLRYQAAPFDGLRLVLWQGNVKVAGQGYGVHFSSFTDDGRYRLKVGKTEEELRFPVDFRPAEGKEYEAQVVGYLPECPYLGKLESGRLKVRWVKKWDWQ